MEHRIAGLQVDSGISVVKDRISRRNGITVTITASFVVGGLVASDIGGTFRTAIIVVSISLSLSVVNPIWETSPTSTIVSWLVFRRPTSITV